MALLATRRTTYTPLVQSRGIVSEYDGCQSAAISPGSGSGAGGSWRGGAGANGGLLGRLLLGLGLDGWRFRRRELVAARPPKGPVHHAAALAAVPAHAAHVQIESRCGGRHEEANHASGGDARAVGVA